MRFGDDGSGSLQRIKLSETDAIFPREDDLDLFKNLIGNGLEEPTPFSFDFELVNVHTGFVIDRRSMKRKPRYNKYKPLKNRPMIALRPNGIDAVNCKSNKAGSFWNGKNFPCLKFSTANADRSDKLTAETDAITRHRFKDFSCNKHKTFKSDAICANCPKN